MLHEIRNANSFKKMNKQNCRLEMLAVKWFNWFANNKLNQSTAELLAFAKLSRQPKQNDFLAGNVTVAQLKIPCRWFCSHFFITEHSCYVCGQFRHMNSILSQISFTLTVENPILLIYAVCNSLWMSHKLNVLEIFYYDLDHIFLLLQFYYVPKYTTIWCIQTDTHSLYLQNIDMNQSICINNVTHTYKHIIMRKYKFYSAIKRKQNKIMICVAMKNTLMHNKNWFLIATHILHYEKWD